MPDPAKKKSGLGPTRGFFDSLLETAVSVPKGIMGIDPTEEEEKDYTVGPSVNKLIQLGMALPKGVAGAALPLAIPRKFHKNIMDELNRLRSTDLSPEYRTLIDRWSSGGAMHDRARNLTYAEQLRNSNPQDLEKVRDVLRQKLGVDKVPVFRGVSGNEMKDLREYHQQGLDPGARSFSMEPKVSHTFADGSSRSLRHGLGIPETLMDLETSHPAIRSRRMQTGQLYKADVPINNVLGYGFIPGQRELIVDLKGLNPDEQLKVLRHNPRSWER